MLGQGKGRDSGNRGRGEGGSRFKGLKPIRVFMSHMHTRKNRMAEKIESEMLFLSLLHLLCSQTGGRGGEGTHLRT